MVSNASRWMTAVLLFGLVQIVAAQCNSRLELSSWDRRQFIQAFYGTRPASYVEFLSERGCEQAVLNSLMQMNASVRFSDLTIGYVLALLPRDQLASALDIPGLAYATPALFSLPPEDAESNLQPAEVGKVSIPVPRVATELSPGGPYFAAPEIGLDELRKDHPTADGRGTAVALVDSGVDLLHPSLRVALNSNGAIVAKVRDIIALSTSTEDRDWVPLGQPIRASNGVIEALGRKYAVPKDGIYRFGIFRQRVVLGPPENTHAQTLALCVGVLVDEETHDVWVDTNGDGSFRDERLLRDFAVSQDIGWFGEKDTYADNRIPFGVKIDLLHNAIYVAISTTSHGGSVVGSLAANRLTGGLYDGAAPSTQIIDVRWSLLTQLAGILQAARRTDVSVINRSAGIARGAYEGAKSDAEYFEQQVLRRMVDVYGKPMVCVCSVDGLISVDDYVSGEMLRRDRQTSGPYVDAIHVYYGARRNFPLVNSVLAPSAQLSTESRYIPEGLIFPDGRRHTFVDRQLDPPAPAGYWIGDNESPTIPVVSGVFADLIGEAKREHVRWDIGRLDQAVFSGTRLIEGIPMYQQGYGLVNAYGAWEQLTKMAKADDPENSALTSFAFSQIEDGRKEDIEGYYKEVTRAAGTLEESIWVTRHGGYAGSREYRFALRGDAESFTLLTTKADLVRDKPAKIRFQAKTDSGFHVTMLELIDAATGTVMQQVPLSVKVPDAPEMVAPGVERYTATMPPRRDDTRIIYLGKDTQAARWHVQIPYERNDNDAYGPGFGACGVKKPDGLPMDAEHYVGPLVTCEGLAANDRAGFQYVLWENRAFHAEYETPYDPPAPTVPITAMVTVTKYAVKIQRSGDALAISNQHAAIDGRAELYDAKLGTDPLTGVGLHAMGELDKTLPANVAEWRLRVTPNGRPEGTSDVYVLNCAGKTGCYVTATQEISATGETLTIHAPQAGSWKIVVRSRNRVQQPQAYSIHEALLTPASTPIEPADSQHASGVSWTLPIPQKRSDAQYAAFHIAGTPGVAGEKNGLVIAMTPLETDAP